MLLFLSDLYHIEHRKTFFVTVFCNVPQNRRLLSQGKAVSIFPLKDVYFLFNKISLYSSDIAFS